MRALAFVTALASTACGPAADQARAPYAFFVAGHVYGTPGAPSVGVYPPFEGRFDRLRAEPNLALGILTGDIVDTPTDAAYDAVEADLSALQVPVRFVAGNHDVLDRSLFQRRYGPTYYAFRGGEDLFIVLDANLDPYNISGDQLDFLQSELQNVQTGQNVFLFCHQVLWWAPDNRFASHPPNSIEGRPTQTNFFDEVAPLLEDLPGPAWMFAGDVGADPQVSQLHYGEIGDLRVVASGMGAGVEDNVVMVRVNANGDVAARFIGLSGDDPERLGPVNQHRIP